MKFPARGAQTLKHLPFFEVLAHAPEESLDARMATAGLLSLRMLDHWVLAGPSIVEPESVSVRSVRGAIMAIPADEPVREALLTTVNTMQMLRHVDLVPVLPRVFAYAQLLERHYGSIALAGDAYESVIRLADLDFDADLVMDSYQRLAFCQRKAGALGEAVASSTPLARIAGRRKDRARVLGAKIGLGQVAMMRGDFADADVQFTAIATEAENHDLTREFAMATHNRAVVAARTQDPIRASVFAHRALKLTVDPVERDRVLGDLGAFLIDAGQYESALDAFRILELTAASEEPRASARVNILVVAARTADRGLFDSTRAQLAGAALAIEARISLLVETAAGFRRFGDDARADAAVAEAVAITQAHGLALEMAAEPVVIARNGIIEYPHGTPFTQGPAKEIAVDLRAMALALLPRPCEQSVYRAAQKLEPIVTGSGAHFDGAVGDEQAAASRVAPSTRTSLWRNDMVEILW